jgi:hypothetical protein
MANDPQKQRPRERRGEDEAKLLDDARSTTLDGLADILAGIHRKKQLSEEAGERRAAAGGDARRVTIDGGETAGDLLFDLARLQLDIVNQVLAFQRRHQGRFIERLRSAPMPGEGESAPPLILKGRPAPEPKNADPKDKELSAPVKFVVENRSTKRAHVSLRLSELRSRDGRAPFRAETKFKWGRPDEVEDTLVLEPDQEREVLLSLHLDRAHFHAGHRYRGHIEISMPGRPKQRLPLRVEIDGEET